MESIPGKLAKRDAFIGQRRRQPVMSSLGLHAEEMSMDFGWDDAVF
jgi:hypothetical protein